MSYLSEVHAVPIHIDGTALDLEGIGLDVSVSGALSDASFHTALFTFLRPLGLTYVIEGDEASNKNLRVKVEVLESISGRTGVTIIKTKVGQPPQSPVLAS